MHNTVIEILLVWVAFIVGVYQQHFQNLLRAIWYPDLWRSAVNSILSFQTLFPLVVLIGLSVGVYFLDKAFKRTADQRRQELQSLVDPLIERLDRLIKIMENNQD